MSATVLPLDYFDQLATDDELKLRADAKAISEDLTVRLKNAETVVEELKALIQLAGAIHQWGRGTPPGLADHLRGLHKQLGNRDFSWPLSGS